MTSTIVRILPQKSSLSTSPRYSSDDIERYRIKKTEEYTKWKNGINSETNRKIKIGGPTHIKLGKKNGYYLGMEIQQISGYLPLLEKYQIDNAIETLRLEQKERDIIARNKLVDKVVQKITNFSWEEFVEFEGVNYGIPEFHNGFHMLNNCMGKEINVVKRWERECSCSCCENWSGCGRSDNESNTYSCDKCGVQNHSVR
jgi:hypothetical protein